MSIDRFTEKCVVRAGQCIAKWDVRAFRIVVLFGPLPPTAFEYLVDRIGKWGRSTESQVESIKSESVTSRMAMKTSVELTSNDSETVRSSTGQAELTDKVAVLAEAQATDEQDLATNSDDGAEYLSDAAYAWDI